MAELIPSLRKPSVNTCNSLPQAQNRGSRGPCSPDRTQVEERIIAEAIRERSESFKPYEAPLRHAFGEHGFTDVVFKHGRWGTSVSFPDGVGMEIAGFENSIEEAVRTCVKEREKRLAAAKRKQIAENGPEEKAPSILEKIKGIPIKDWLFCDGGDLNDLDRLKLVTSEGLDPEKWEASGWGVLQTGWAKVNWSCSLPNDDESGNVAQGFNFVPILTSEAPSSSNGWVKKRYVVPIILKDNKQSCLYLCSSRRMEDKRPFLVMDFEKEAVDVSGYSVHYKVSIRP